MRIIGLDLSITCTGLSLPDGTTQAFRPRSSGDNRLREIADHLILTVFACAPVELIVIEGLSGLYKGEAARVIPMLHGAVRLDLLRHKVPYMLLNPSSLKKFVTGSGTADKTAMALAALKRLGREYGTSDECDADWLRIAGLFAYGAPEPVRSAGQMLTMPQAQVQALVRGVGGKPVEWPVVGGRLPWSGVVR